MKLTANIIKFCLILIGLLSFNSLFGQEEDEYTYYTYVPNKNIFEGGVNFFMPQRDLDSKLNKNIYGASFSYFRQLNQSRIFAGINMMFRSFDSFTVENRFADTNQTTKSSHFNLTLSSRIYPEIYFSVFEFYFEGGLGLNSAYTVTNLYDIIAESSYNEFTESKDRKLFLYGAFGCHISISESIFISPQVNSSIGPSFDYMVKKPDDAIYLESYDAFELKSSIYNAVSISLSLSYIF